MNDFKDAARAASADIRKEMQSKITEILQSCQALGLINDEYEFEDATVISEGDGVDAAITKHYAEIEATYGKLVELAGLDSYIDYLKTTLNRINHGNELLDAQRKRVALLADTAIAAAIERMRGDAN